MYNRILVPLDGSEIADTALPHVEEVAKKFGAEVLLLQAVPSLEQVIMQTSAASPMGPGSMGEISVDVAQETMDAEKAAAQAYLGDIQQRLAGDGIQASCHIREGHPGSVILEFAAESNIDLIAMCTHGRGGLGRLVFGSVTDEVLRNAPDLPMLLVRARNKE